jgi:2-octaprenyl-6-methoxyphenol hydroxylase
MQEQTFDVIIAGGGLAGLSQALALAPLKKHNGTPLSIAIVEASEQTLNSQGVVQGAHFDARVLALSAGTVDILKQLNAWPAIAEHACAIKNIHISDQGHYGKARLSAKAQQVNALGYVAELKSIGAALLKQLQPFGNVQWFAPDSIKSIDWQQQQVTVMLASQTSLQARLLLACDGGQSPSRQLAKIEVSHSDYHQVAVIANVELERPHHNKAFERFTENGPLAILPLNGSNGKLCSLVWTIKPEQLDNILSLDDAQFCRHLTQKFGLWLGKVTACGKRFSYPLQLVTANEQIRHRFALVGNASHTIHPIAGQGFNLGIRDVDCMRRLIARALESGEDIGALPLLQVYARERQQDHNQVIMATDTMVSIFSNSYFPLVVGRNIGLKVVNYLTPLKNHLGRFFMGKL